MFHHHQPLCTGNTFLPSPLCHRLGHMSESKRSNLRKEDDGLVLQNFELDVSIRRYVVSFFFSQGAILLPFMKKSSYG